MQKVWELYAIATKIIEKLCENKCYHLGHNIIENCYDYIRKRLEKDNFKALKKYDPHNAQGAKESTYLHMLVSSRLIDFFNSAPHKRELLVMSSISDRSQEDNITDYCEIVDDICETLTYEEQTYLQYRYTDELSYKQIGDIFGITHKQASKKVENIQKKLKNKFKKSGLTLEDIL